MVTVARWIKDVQEQFSPNTARGWSTYLTVLSQSLGEKQLDAVKPSDIEKLMRKVQANALKRAVSKNGTGAAEGFLSAARAVWARGIADGKCSSNPAVFVKGPKRTLARDRRALTTDELDLVWQALATRTRDPVLALLIYRVALETGARRGEILGMSTKSLEKASGTIRIEAGAKNNKPRSQPITAALWDALQTYIDDRIDAKSRKNTPLFVNLKGEPITRRWFEYNAAIIRDEVPELGASGDLFFTWHLLRHTAGTMVERSGGYAVASRFLGHDPGVRSGVTLEYTKATMDEVRDTLQTIWGQPMAGLSTRKTGQRKS